VAHRTTKPLNVLVDANEDFILGDYGLCNSKQLKAGTPPHFAPE